MAVTQRIVHASPERIFDVLRDGWTYSDWVVGTAHIRAVDPHWPAPGANLYHKAGPWPLSLRDRTEVLSCTEPTELVLQPHLWPLGEATVAIRLTPVGENATQVTIAEDFAAGPLRWLRSKINDLVLHHRNRETLRRLADIATRGREGAA
ncbi:MAG TPA: SRPBCC family protein [Pilimelia sp.]|nr:SRPBCC family protein [Pilimelia sp.]